MEPSKPQYDILTSRQPVNLFLSGQGGGKTHCAGAVSSTFISNFPKVRGLIAANTYDQLNRSTMFRVREVWKHDFKIEEYNELTGKGCYVIGKHPPKHFNTDGHNFDRYNNIVSFDNGAVVYIGSFDNYKALDGMEIGWAILDETKDTKEEAVKEVIIGRLRQQGIWIGADGSLNNGLGKDEKALEEPGTPFNPLYIFTSPAKVQWLNEWFNLDKLEAEIRQTIYSDTTYFKKKVSNKLITISSTYHNLKNLPSNYIDNQKANMHTALQDMLIYGNPFSRSGGEFYKCFDRSKHVGKPEYNRDLPLHISFDFNLNPYMTCTIWQMSYKHTYCIDEICLSTPDNRTISVCREFSRRYQSHRAGLFVYGDPSGKTETTNTEQGEDNFKTIITALAIFKPSKRVAQAHPSVTMRGNFINTILEQNFSEITIMINEKCVKMINDLSYLKEKSDGTKLKEEEVNPETKVKFEKYGHTSDSMDYFLCEAFKSEYLAYQNGPGGNKPIIQQRNVRANY
jgi:hypothetical protein